MKNLVYPLVFAVCSIPAFAWNGEDTDSGYPVQINSADVVSYGDTIQYTIGDSGEYRTATVISIFDANDGSSKQLQVRDEQFGDVHQFIMK